MKEMGFERRTKIFTKKFWEPVPRPIFATAKLESRANLTSSAIWNMGG
ncbi:MAG: hypothetical protein HYV67_00265 [Candidatus Taylorbacteria bacterium]|nr:hypothetical protein [Candidatus Taylorbacteria bacterium]